MNYKVQGAFRRNKKYMIIFGILWIFIAIVLIIPFTIGYNTAIVEKNLGAGFAEFTTALLNLPSAFEKLSSQNLFPTYLQSLGLFSLVYAIFFIIGIARSVPKHEYTDFEHGSSDWSLQQHY